MRINGAVYIPSYSYNAYMMWRNYNRRTIETEFGFAKTAGINALRLWLSYENWKEDSPEYKSKLDHLLRTAEANDLRILPSLFECCTGNGGDYDYSRPEDLPLLAINSPGTRIQKNEALWDGPASFVDWFMKAYGDDRRLLAVEVANEPQFNRNNDMPFAMAMFKVARSLKGKLPLTVGSISLEHNIPFLELGLDILQFHDNFPRSGEDFERGIKAGKELEALLKKPVWITEWPRVRRTGPGWETAEIPESDKHPDLASLAPILERNDMTGFFWSLMVKPAYLNAQRVNKTFNGLFQKDGRVWSVRDARSISGSEDPGLKEDKTSPYDVCEELKEA